MNKIKLIDTDKVVKKSWEKVGSLSWDSPYLEVLRKVYYYGGETSLFWAYAVLHTMPAPFAFSICKRVMKMWKEEDPGIDIEDGPYQNIYLDNVMSNIFSSSSYQQESGYKLYCEEGKLLPSEEEIVKRILEQKFRCFMIERLWLLDNRKDLFEEYYLKQALETLYWYDIEWLSENSFKKTRSDWADVKEEKVFTLNTRKNISEEVAV